MVEKGEVTVASGLWNFHLVARFGHQEVTGRVEELVLGSGVRAGMVTIGVTGSTGAITTIEYEAGALADLREALDRIAPEDGAYEHNERWGDGNGFSHVRSALMKTSISVPIVDARMQLGTWQQIVVLNLDNRDRDRAVVATVVGI